MLENVTAEPLRVVVKSFDNQQIAPLVLWQPEAGAREITLPIELTIPRDQVAIVTEEAALEQLAHVPRWQAEAGQQRGSVVFDLRAASDLANWTLTGNAFSVSSLPGVFWTPTLNSIGQAGEAATGSALSPPFAIEPGFDRLEIVFHGGTRHKSEGKENLTLQLKDADTGATLYETVPPSTHVLTKLNIPLADIKAGRVRLLLIDDNTNNSFAWIGLRRVTSVRSTGR